MLAILDTEWQHSTVCVQNPLATGVNRTCHFSMDESTVQCRAVQVRVGKYLTSLFHQSMVAINIKLEIAAQGIAQCKVSAARVVVVAALRRFG